MCKACEVIKTESAGRRPLSLTHPHLMDEWDFVKNGEVRPEYLTYGMVIKVHWYHEAEDGQIHEWEACISDRAKKNRPTKCPYCENRKVGYGNDLKTKFPKIAEEWHPTKNGKLRPEDVTCGSNLKVWWFHEKDGVTHEWEARVNKRTKKHHPTKCPYCENQKVGYGNDLKTNFPELAKQWHPIKNGDLRPEHVTPGSKRKVHWQHEKDGVLHEWVAAVAKRTKKNNPTSCPYCENHKAGHGNDLLTNFPELCEKEWNYNRNKKGPEEYLPYSNKKVWWQHIDEKGVLHEWEAIISNRTRECKPVGCPYCENKKVGYGNDLKTNYPELSEEWDKEKNKGFLPSMVTSGSGRKVYWKCRVCNHSWRTSILSRTGVNKTGCPFCSPGPVSKVSQKWLDSLNIQNILREHYIKELKLTVDGFDSLTNTVYEFLGDYWHGNPDKFISGKINKRVKKSFGALNTETMNRLNLLKTKYNVIYIWEKDYLEGKPPTVLLQNTQSVLSI